MRLARGAKNQRWELARVWVHVRTVPVFSLNVPCLVIKSLAAHLNCGVESVSNEPAGTARRRLRHALRLTAIALSRGFGPVIRSFRPIRMWSGKFFEHL